MEDLADRDGDDRHQREGALVKVRVRVKARARARGWARAWIGIGARVGARIRAGARVRVGARVGGRGEHGAAVVRELARVDVEVEQHLARARGSG